MFLLIVLTIAVWFIPNIPIALPILATIACSMSVVVELTRAACKVAKKHKRDLPDFEE